MLISVTALFAGLAGGTTSLSAQASDTTYKNSYSFHDAERDVGIDLNFQSIATIQGDVNITLAVEHNDETLKNFQKYARKKIDSAAIGEVIYVSISATNEEDAENLSGTYKFTVSLPKSYNKKELAVIPFTDYRSPQNIRTITKNDDGTYSFIGDKNSYAYAIVYNGAYKQVIWIIIIMIIVLIVCVLVKIYCLRRDNPEIQERKKQKAVAKKKQQHKKNKKIAQELKREREKLKSKSKT